MPAAVCVTSPACLIHGAGGKLAAGASLAAPSPLASNLPLPQSGCHVGSPLPPAFPSRPRLSGRAGAEHRGADPTVGHPGGAAARGPGSCLPRSRQRATVLTELLLTRQAFVRADQRCLSGVLNRIKSCNQTHTQARRSAQLSSPRRQGCCEVARLSRILPPETWGSGVPPPIPTTCMKLLALLVCNLLAWRVGETGLDAPEKLSALAPGGNRERGWGMAGGVCCWQQVWGGGVHPEHHPLGPGQACRGLSE